jgi:hypothetical protein
MSRYGGWAMKVALAVMIVAATAAPIALAATYAFPDILNDIDPPVVIGELRATLAALTAAAVIGAAISYYIVRMFENIRRHNTPFREEVVEDLRLVAKLLIVFTFAVPIVGWIAAWLADVSAESIFEFNLLTLFAAFLVYLLSLIFSYGTELQKEADETL